MTCLGKGCRAMCACCGWLMCLANALGPAKLDATGGSLRPAGADNEANFFSEGARGRAGGGGRNMALCRPEAALFRFYPESEMRSTAFRDVAERPILGGSAVW